MLSSRRRPPKPESWAGDSGLRPVWSMTHDADEVEDAIHAALRAIREDGLPWFDRFTDPREVLRTFREDEQDMEGTWGFGNPGSPARSELIETAETYLRG